MTQLVRKIDKGKWLKTDIANGADVSADAVTNCMKTKGNTLSVWEVDRDVELDNAVLAIVSVHQHLEAIDVVVLDSEYLRENGVDCIKTDGFTYVSDLVQTHQDLSYLSYKKLGIIAYHIAHNIVENKIQRYTRGQLKIILKEAIRQGRLDINDLSDSISKKL